MAETWEERAARNGWFLYQHPLDVRHRAKRPEGYYYRVLQRVDCFELRHYPEYPEYGYSETWSIVACEQPFYLLPTECFISREEGKVVAEWNEMVQMLQTESVA